MKALDLVIGSGGVLSHAPDRKQAALMMIDAYQLEGITQVAVDSIFMLPHLGVFSEVHPEAAEQILTRDCLVNICHVVAPIFPLKYPGQLVADVYLNSILVAKVIKGEMVICAEVANKKGILKVVPLKDSVDVGAGPGKTIERQVELGGVGLVLDGRNRPLIFADDSGDRVEFQKRTFKAFGLQGI